mgnify:CR=1 FL=1
MSRKAREPLPVAELLAKKRDGGTLTNEELGGLITGFMDGSVALDVRDDGKGFAPDAGAPDGHIGLAAMRERVESVHGVMEIESAPGDGTAISINVATGGDSHV